MSRANTSGLRFEPITVPLAGSTVSNPPTLLALNATGGGFTKGSRKSGVMQPFLACQFYTSMTAGTSSEVNASGYGFKMGWIHAGSDSAQVIEVNLLHNWAMFLYIERSMGKLCTKKSPAELAVAVPVNRTLPYPASIAVYRVSGPVVDEGTRRRSSGSLASIMLLAQSTLKSTLDTLMVLYQAQRIHDYTLTRGREA